MLFVLSNINGKDSQVEFSLDLRKEISNKQRNEAKNGQAQIVPEAELN